MKEPSFLNKTISEWIHLLVAPSFKRQMVQDVILIVGSDAMPPLAHALTQDDPALRRAIIECLTNCHSLHLKSLRLEYGVFDAGPVIPVLSDLIQKNPGDCRWPAAYALANIAPAHSGLQSLISGALKEGAKEDRRSACRLIQNLGEFGRCFLPILWKLATDSDPQIRDASIDAIARFSTEKEFQLSAEVLSPILSHLMAALNTTDKPIDHWVLHRLGALGSWAKPALPRIGEIGGDHRYGQLRFLATWTHFRIDGDVEGFVRRLRSVVETANSEARQGFFDGLVGVNWAGFNEKYPHIVPHLAPIFQQLLLDQDAEIRWHAALAVKMLALSDATLTQALHNALSDANADVRFFAIQALGSMGAAARLAVPRLREFLTDKACFRLRTMVAIWQIDPSAIDIDQAVSEEIQRNDPETMLFLLNTVAQLPESTQKTAASWLVKFLNTERDDLKRRKEAIYSLHRMLTSMEIAIPTLTQIMRHADEDIHVRLAAAGTLPAHGMPASALLD